MSGPRLSFVRNQEPDYVKGGKKPDQRAEQNTATAAVGVRWSEEVGIRLGVFASVPGALTRREQLMSSRGSCIGYKGGRAGREAVHTLV